MKENDGIEGRYLQRDAEDRCPYFESTLRALRTKVRQCDDFPCERRSSYFLLVLVNLPVFLSQRTVRSASR